MSAQHDTCQGYTIKMPTTNPPSNPFLSYPFGLHTRQNYHWNVRIEHGILTVFAQNCDKVAQPASSRCWPCEALSRANTLAGIESRMATGVAASSSHQYQSFGGLLKVIERKDSQIRSLRLSSFTSTRALQRRTKTLMDYKKLVMALGQQDIPRVHSILSTAIRQNLGVNAIFERVTKAANHLLRPKGFQEHEMVLAWLFLVLGGSKVAHVASRASGGPSVSTIRQFHVCDPLVASPSKPRLDEILSNIDISFPSSGPFAFSRQSQKLQAVLMIDEVKSEQRIRYCPKTNKLLGLCREHSESFSLEFASMVELEQLHVGLANDKVHRATEVCVLNPPKNLLRLEGCSLIFNLLLIIQGYRYINRTLILRHFLIQ